MQGHEQLASLLATDGPCSVLHQRGSEKLRRQVCGSTNTILVTDLI